MKNIIAIALLIFFFVFSLNGCDGDSSSSSSDSSSSSSPAAPVEENPADPVDESDIIPFSINGEETVEQIAKAGKYFKINLTISCLDDSINQTLAAFEGCLYYDPKVIEFICVYYGNDLGDLYFKDPDLPEAYLNNNFVYFDSPEVDIYNEVDSERLCFYANSFLSEEDINDPLDQLGSFRIATFIFKVLLEEKTNLFLTRVVLGDAEANKIPIIN